MPYRRRNAVRGEGGGGSNAVASGRGRRMALSRPVAVRASPASVPRAFAWPAPPGCCPSAASGSRRNLTLEVIGPDLGTEGDFPPAGTVLGLAVVGPAALVELRPRAELLPLAETGGPAEVDDFARGVPDRLVEVADLLGSRDLALVAGERLAAPSARLCERGSTG